MRSVGTRFFALICVVLVVFGNRESREEPSNFLSHADSRCQTRLTAPFCAPLPARARDRPPASLSYVCSYLVAAYLNSDPLSVQGDLVIL